MKRSTIVCSTALAACVVACHPRAQDTEDRTDTTQQPAASAETNAATAAAPSTPAPSATTATTAKLPPFEGELRLKAAGNAPETLDYAMKGDKIRLGLDAAPGKKDHGIDAIIDTDDQKATVLLNDRKQFVDVDLAKLAHKAKQRLENVDVKRTGETASIAGHTCEKWNITDRDYRISACVMKGAPYFDLDALEQQAGFTAPPWVHRIVDEGYVPLRVTVANAQGKTLGESQITDTSRTVDPKEFQVPPGYTKTDASKLTNAIAPKK